MPDSRRSRVLVALEASTTPLTIEQVAESTGLHVNTVRNHLDVLVAGGSVQREPLPAGGRGRPRFVYRPAGGPSPTQALVSALTAQFGSADRTVVEQAAERWVEHIGGAREANSPGEAVGVVVEELNELGFAAEEGLIGDIIVLRACPYADLVEQSPIICEIHTALESRLFAATGQEVSLRSMDIAPVPNTCVVRLARPDLIPHRVIEPDTTKAAR